MTYRRLMRTISFIALSMCFAASVFSKTSMTGLYGVIGACNDKTMDEIGGDPGTYTHFSNCFLGKPKFTAAEFLSIVQNKDFVCAYHVTSFNKFYEGRMVGRTTPTGALLFYEDGHSGPGVTPQAAITKTSSGLIVDKGNGWKTVYVKRAASPVDSSLISKCKPEIPASLSITESYKFEEVPGLLNTVAIKFQDFQDDVTQRQPSHVRIDLTQKKTSFQFIDRRADLNYRLRMISVTNTSSQNWTACVVHPMACGDWLRHGTESKIIANSALEARNGVAVKGMNNFLSCKNSIWSFQQDSACETSNDRKTCPC
jgi:hypothetical protein